MNRPDQMDSECTSFEAYLGALLVLLCLLGAALVGAFMLYRSISTMPSADHAVTASSSISQARGW